MRAEKVHASSLNPAQSSLEKGFEKLDTATEEVLRVAAQKDQFMVYAQDNGAAVLAIVAAGSIVAFLYNVTHNTLMKRTSSVAVCFTSVPPYLL